MILQYTIEITQTLIWLLPIYKQWKSPEYKYFFLVLGLIDSFNYLVYLFYRIVFKFSTGSYNLYTIELLILFFTLIPFFMNNKRMVYLTLVTIPFCILTSYSLPFRTAKIIAAIQVALIFFVILNKFVQFVSKNRIVLLFHLVLIAYMLSNFLKFTISLTNMKTGPIYFIITTSIQIFFAIYFMIDSDYKPRFIIYNGNIEKNTASELN